MKPDYRDQVFAMLPTLEVLDGMNKEGEEVYEEEEDDDDEDEEDFVAFEGEEGVLPEGELESDSGEEELVPGKRAAPIKGKLPEGLDEDEDEEEEDEFLPYMDIQDGVSMLT